MNIKQVCKIVQQGRWWTEEAPGSVQLFHYIMKCFVHQNVMGRTTLQKTIYITTRDGLASEITPADEKEKIFKEIIELEKKHPGWFVKEISFWKDLKKKQDILNARVRLGLASLSEPELLKLYQDLHHINFGFVVYGTFIECLDPFSEKLLPLFAKKYKLNDTQAAADMITLSTPKERSFLTQEKIDFLKACLGQMKVQEFYNKYYWFETNYKEAHELTPKEIRKRIKNALSLKTKEEIQREIEQTETAEEELHKTKKKVAQRIKLSTEDKTIFELISLFGYLMDFRKENMMKATYSRYRIIEEIARRKKIDMETILLMTTEEGFAFLKGEKINLTHIRNRKNGVVFYFTPQGEIEFQGKEAEEIYHAYIDNILSLEFKGNVSYNPGHSLRGKVCKVMNTRTDTFEENTILVTTMTRPEFMQLMRKAKAVITDEGGITCHAAIVSRELKLPCIIGTKIATKKLKTGDEIEMNFETGTVKIRS